MYIIKERKWQLSWHCHDNSYAAGVVLIETKIPRFYLKQGSSTPNNLFARVNTIWEPCVFRAKPSVLALKCYKWGYLVLKRKRLEPRVLLWQQNGRYHSVWFVMYITGAKFEDHCFNISGDILDSVFYYLCGTVWHHHFPHLHNTKTWISLKWKKISQKGKRHSSWLWNPFKKAAITRIFYFMGTLKWQLQILHFADGGAMNFQCDLEITRSSTCEKPFEISYSFLTEDSCGTIIRLLPPNFDWVFSTVVILSKSLMHATLQRGS